jgi:hypothetical protein
LRAWYEVKFNLEFRTQTGTEFQDLFTAIMQRRYPGDFQKVKPYGNQGDLKCDGYHPSLSRIFQVYAPEQMVSATTIKKINEDFRGAIFHWKTMMKGWVFVHNQYRGLPPDVVKRLSFISRCKTIKVEHWCEVELANEFFKLLPGDQAAILGHAPTPESVMRLELSDVVSLVELISQQPAPLSEPVGQVPAGKLEANALSSSVKDLLLLGSRKSKLVKDLFSKWHDPLLGDRIAASFRARYETLKAEGKRGDEVFLELWRYAGASQHSSIARESAVLTLLAFLFEECEIFEPARLQEAP